MRPNHTDHFFTRFTYVRTSEEVVAKMKPKAEALRAKVEERKLRIKRIREEFKITDLVLIDLLKQARDAAKNRDNRMSYSVSNAVQAKNDASGYQSDDETFTIGAGTVNALLTEEDFITAETEEAKRLDLIIRNLRDEERDWSEGRKVGQTLSEDEMEYLGF